MEINKELIQLHADNLFTFGSKKGILVCEKSTTEISYDTALKLNAGEYYMEYTNNQHNKNEACIIYFINNKIIDKNNNVILVSNEKEQYIDFEKSNWSIL